MVSRTFERYTFRNFGQWMQWILSRFENLAENIYVFQLQPRLPDTHEIPHVYAHNNGVTMATTAVTINTVYINARFNYNNNDG